MSERAAEPRSARPAVGMFERFVHSEAAGSVVLLACTAAAMVWANSPWAAAYDAVAHTKIGVSWGGATFALSLQHWINDLLMAIFFFVVGLEIKREVVVGQLSSPSRALLPVMAALGGMIVPAGFYAALNGGGPGAPGWGIPMATDIAFALGILALAGRGAPVGLKVFLTALAIADDLGAVLVIALFYTSALDVRGLAAAGVCLGLIALAGRVGVRAFPVYVLLAIGVWAGTLASGIHATVAGVLVALLVPVRLLQHPATIVPRIKALSSGLDESALTPSSMVGDRPQLDAIVELNAAASSLRPPGLTLEQALHPFVVWVVLPLFAFFNAGVSVGDLSGGFGPVGIGVVLGLVLGKQIGVLGFSWAAARVLGAQLPAGVRWGHVYGASALAGIGFTMSIFITGLAFPEGPLVAEAKLAILVASFVAAVWGAVALRLVRGAT